MTPAELKEWYYAIRDILQDALPGRDSKLWSYGWTVGLVVVGLAHEKPDLFPAGWPQAIEHWGGIVALVAGKMGWSWAGSPRSNDEGEL